MTRRTGSWPGRWGSQETDLLPPGDRHWSRDECRPGEVPGQLAGGTSRRTTRRGAAAHRRLARGACRRRRPAAGRRPARHAGDGGLPGRRDRAGLGRRRRPGGYRGPGGDRTSRWSRWPTTFPPTGRGCCGCASRPAPRVPSPIGPPRSSRRAARPARCAACRWTRTGTSAHGRMVTASAMFDPNSAGPETVDDEQATLDLLTHGTLEIEGGWSTRPTPLCTARSRPAGRNPGRR